MELPQIGKHCANEQCKQLDFLPLQCSCGKVFCSKHLRSHVETCTSVRTLKDDELKLIENVFVCSKDDCKERSVVPLTCSRCKKHFCIKHRHLTECEEKSQEEVQNEKEKFARPIREFHQAKAIVDKQVETTLAKAKNKETALKVQLMKLKGRAKGVKTIPSTDRLYFNVLTSNGNSFPVFVSKTWSLGRALDAIALECKLSNSNKLVLLRKEGRTIIFNNLSDILSHLIDKQLIINGEDLIIS
ncbi:hypothetical protein ABEB36_015418 [Hypothenemus hampei]|uniref:AN1-type domain-containing protein n=1 Tax=Hypothenemus hampei TaxID=57062 RepID=A0ABD1E045_HYPHA